MNTAKRLDFDTGHESHTEEKLTFQTAEEHGFEPARFGKRLIAFVIDAMIAGAAAKLLIGYVFMPLLKGSSSGVLFELMVQIVVSALVIPVFYWIFPTMYFGATPGKKMLGLRVIRTDGNMDVEFGQMFLRETIGRTISLLPLFLGYFWCLFNEDRKTWHDKMAGTRVIEYR